VVVTAVWRGRWDFAGSGWEIESLRVGILQEYFVM